MMSPEEFDTKLKERFLYFQTLADKQSKMDAEKLTKMASKTMEMWC